MKVAGASPPDGYTLLFASSSSFVAPPEIAKDYPYDLVRDFVSIASSSSRWRSVPPSLGVGTFGELIEYVKPSETARTRRSSPKRCPRSLDAPPPTRSPRESATICARC
jgi:tripartite-type tricarboxylate transporter receptor subunit TctC